jgi:hypothetical protein
VLEKNTAHIAAITVSGVSWIFRGLTPAAIWAWYRVDMVPTAVPAVAMHMSHRLADPYTAFDFIKYNPYKTANLGNMTKRLRSQLTAKSAHSRCGEDDNASRNSRATKRMLQRVKSNLSHVWRLA